MLGDGTWCWDEKRGAQCPFASRRLEFLFVSKIWDEFVWCTIQYDNNDYNYFRIKPIDGSL